MTKIFYFLLAVVIGSFLATHAPNLEIDSDPSYLTFGPNRPPLYPLFLAMFHWAGQYQFKLVTYLQGLFLFAALLYARHWLKSRLGIPEFSIFLMSLVVVVTIGLHFQIWFIQSEGLAFPLFIVTFFQLLDCFQGYQLKRLCYLALSVSLLVLIRLQFIYFYALFGLLCLWYLWQQVPKKKVGQGALVLFGSMLLTIQVDHGYHYYKHGHYAGAPYAGILFLVQALYLADNQAANSFQNSIDKATVQALIDQRNKQHLGSTYDLNAGSMLTYQDAYEEYSRDFLPIQRIIENTLDTSVENIKGKKTSFQANVAAMNIAKQLMRDNPMVNFKFLVWKFVESMDGVPVLIFFLILSFSILFKMVADKLRQLEQGTVFVAMVSLITMINAAMIALCNPNLPVYFCYSQFMLYSLIIYLVKRSFNP